jgi:hypothetical protein
MSKRDLIKIAVNLLSGVLTLFLQSFIPVGGGGISLILDITIPITIGISIISSAGYILLVKKNKKAIKNTIVYLSIILNLIITFAMYPYDH